VIGRLAITPFALRGLVRITAGAGDFHGSQMVEVEYVGAHPFGYADGSKGCYGAAQLTMVQEGQDVFCRSCGWVGQLKELSVFDDLPCNECGSLQVASIPVEEKGDEAV
jgi:hypothetical protein